MPAVPPGCSRFPQRSISDWRLFLAAVATSVSVAGFSHAAEPDAAASAKRCFKCHGEDGLEAGEGEPVIAGQPVAYIVASLELFQSGDRADASMKKRTKNMSREEMEAAARHFSGLRNTSPRQSFDADLVKKGAGIHLRWCEKCHVDGGRGFTMQNTPGPVLAGQPAKYLQAQIGEFMKHARAMPSGMGIAMLELLPGDANALVHYYISRAP